MSTMNSEQVGHGPVKAGHLMEHEYDGIREYDNPTPSWWHVIFLGSCLFSAVYFFWYHFSPLSVSVEQAWQKQQVAEYKKIFGTLGELSGDEATIQKMRGEPRLMTIAQGMFESNCAACHARDGGGINGFNLTDDSYKNIKTIPDFFKVITNGAANGAMPPWSAKLTQNERVLVAAYVANLRGTTPAAPRGADPAEVVIPPWPK
ncbi:MAG TPA: cbb3-type cytochrome c oxidase N-terminal domain-containing protein [Phycisphaerales bacterium]|nr:cbb3-type cytochrome c oxidase N-terminal domain-containing protein [Phycisphaerales bacterium]